MATKKKPSPAPKPAAPPKKPRSQPIEIQIDPALKRDWKKLLGVLESSTREGMQAWDRKYEAVGQILAHTPPLYLAGGVATAGDFFTKYLPGEDERSVLRSVRVAQYASPDEEARYGTSKLDAAIDYLEAKQGKPTSGRIPVDFEKLRIATGKDTIAFVSASVAEVRAAARLAARAKNPAPAAKRNPVVIALTKGLPKQGKGVTVHVAAGHVHLGSIPVAHFAEVLRALAAVKLPTQKS